MRRLFGCNVFAAFTAGLLLQCADEPSCQEGAEGCACADGRCLGELKCLSGLCVDDGSGSAGPSGPGDPTTTSGDGTDGATMGGTTTSPTGPTGLCGNGVLDDDESCDDGNAVNNDACDNECDETPKGILLLPDFPTEVRGQGNGNFQSRVCDLSVLVGVTLWHEDNKFTQIEGSCGVLALVPKGDGFAVEVSPGAALPVIGVYPGGVPLSPTCPKDHVIVSFAGSYLDYIAHMLFACAPIIVEKVAGEYTIRPGAPVPLPMAGDIGALEFAETPCHADRVFNGYRSQIDFHMSGFGGGCTSMTLTY